MIPMIFDIGAGELLAIVIIAVVLFGPDKVPEMAHKAGRIIAYLRGIANSATDTLKSQLGPEFADLTPADLQPRRLLERTILRDVQADLDGIKSQVEGLKNDLIGQLDPVKADLNASMASARSGLSGIEAALNDATVSLNRAVQATEQTPTSSDADATDATPDAVASPEPVAEATPDAPPAS